MKKQTRTFKKTSQKGVSTEWHDMTNREARGESAISLAPQLVTHGDINSAGSEGMATTVKYIKCFCPPDSRGGLRLRIPFYHPESTIVRRAPALTLYESVFLSLPPYTCTLCLMFYLDPSVVGLTPPCTCWRKNTIT